LFYVSGAVASFGHRFGGQTQTAYPTWVLIFVNTLGGGPDCGGTKEFCGNFGADVTAFGVARRSFAKA